MYNDNHKKLQSLISRYTFFNVSETVWTLLMALPRQADQDILSRNNLQMSLNSLFSPS